MKGTHLVVLAIFTLGIGWLMAIGWQHLIASVFTNHGAAVIVTHPGALPAERVGITLITGLSVLIAVLIEQAADRFTGRCILPVWALLLALVVGENLGIGLRLVTLATVTLPEAISAAHNATPVIDLATTNLTGWAVAGLVASGVVSLGLVVVMGRLEA